MSKVKLKEIGVFKNGLNFSADRVAKGCKMIGIPDFGNRYFADLSSLSEIDNTIVPDEYTLKDGDILFVRSNGNKALVGRTMIIKGISERITFSGFCIRFRPNSEIAIPLYLLLLFKSPIFRKRFSKTQQTSINNINQEVLGEIEIDLPAKDEQKKIIDCIFPIIQKIEINNAINDNLQQQLHLLYDYWFTQFDFPDENGKPYRSSGGKMVWNDTLKAEIPTGWNIGILSDIAQITMGQSPSGSTLNKDGGTLFFQGSSDFGKIYPDNRVYTTEPNRMALSGDTLLSVRAPVGAINIAYSDCCIGRGLAAIRGKTDNTCFVRYQLKRNSGFFAKSNYAGTTFGSITKDDLHNMPVVIPNSEITAAFERIAEKQEKMLYKNTTEMRQLSRLQKWLFPMLMNGQAAIID